MSAPRVELGRTFVTGSIQQFCSSDDRFAAFIGHCLERHRRGDWGELDAEDTKANNDSLGDPDGRILSSYSLASLPVESKTPLAASHLWIITEAGPITTVLWPSEY